MTRIVKPLSEANLRVYEAIEQYYSLNGISPTYRELYKILGMNSKQTVSGHILRLQAAGWITRVPNSPRSIVPVHYPRVHYRHREGESGE